MSYISSFYIIPAILFLFALRYLPNEKNQKLGIIFFLTSLVLTLGINFFDDSIYENLFYLTAIFIGLMIGLIIPIKNKTHPSCILSTLQALTLISFALLSATLYQQHSLLFILSLIVLLSSIGTYLFLWKSKKTGNPIPAILIYSLVNILTGLFFLLMSFILLSPALILFSTLLTSISYVYLSALKKALNFSFRNVCISKRKKVETILPKDAYYLLERAQNVLIVPGYGFALSQAQSVLKELVKILENKGSHVYFVIHPLAGRMYGHMNVLLSEINIPEEKIIEIDDLPNHLSQMDVCLAIGANDIINPETLLSKDHPLWGMQNLHLDKAKNVFILKRSLNHSSSGVSNPLFYAKNSKLILGDAKETLQELISQF